MRLLAICAGLMTATASWADDAALLIGNERYTVLDRLIGGSTIATSQNGLEAAGFTVFPSANASGSIANAVAQDFATEASTADRLIVGLSGRFLTDGDRTWLLPVDASEPSLFLTTDALSLESIFKVMASAQGQSILILGLDTSEDQTFGPHLREGLGNLNIPQGVTVVQASPNASSGLLKELAQPGADVMQIVAGNRRFSADGFTPNQLVLVTEATSVAVVEQPDTGTDQIDLTAEKALWDGARALDTQAAYRNYIDRYPSGSFVSEAERLITEIATEPNRPARLAEESLNLSRDARRDIQRDLTLLDFNPRGIDGIFGPGTRNAVKNWQQQNGYSQTSYVTTEQINRLDAQAARRSAELEAEAERARQQQQRLDRAYWEETGARGDEPGLRAYVERYPDGIFATQASAALAEFDIAKQEAAAAEDNAAWERAVAANSVSSYETYLQAFPQGAFVPEAQASISTLTEPADANDAADVAAESALGLNAITLRLVEARLRQLGLEPGQVDGTLDAESRRALRNFQRDRSLTISGFLNEETIVRLLADGLKSLGD